MVNYATSLKCPKCNEFMDGDCVCPTCSKCGSPNLKIYDNDLDELHSIRCLECMSWE